MKKDQIIELAGKISKKKGKTIRQKRFNLFSEWKLKENDHTKFLLALLKFTDINGNYSMLQSFLTRFTKGRGKMVHYKRPSNVSIQFGKKYDNDSFLDGLILMEASNKRIALIIENKILDATDQDGQIRRYISHVCKFEKIDLENVWVFYLTGDGSKEVGKSSYDLYEEESATDIGRRFLTLSYKEDIINWLKEDILGPSIYPETLTTAVKNYVDYLENDLFCLDVYDKVCLDYLYQLLKIGSSPKKMKEDDFKSLYSFQTDVAQVRHDLSEDDSANEQDINAVEELYKATLQMIKSIEEESVVRLERVSTNVLNEWWKRELKRKSMTWKARHRSLATDRGFIQLCLTDEWGTNHMEWIPISVEKLYNDKNYVLELHVEGNKPLADEWRQELKKDMILLPNGKVKNSSSRVFHYEFSSPKPLARMTDAELEKFLKKLYTQELNYIFRMLIEKVKDYRN